MSRKNIAFFILLLTPFLLFMSSAEESADSNSRDFVGKVVNFLLLFGGLGFLLRKPLGNFLQGRADSLRSSMLEAEDSRKKAELKQQEIELRLERFEEEIKKIRQVAEDEGDDLRKSIMQGTEREAGRLKILAQQEIERLTKAGITEIREHMANLATGLAQRNILERMTGEDQSSLIDRSIERLEELYEKPTADQTIRTGTR
jgi:F-type H+-transporting ATPase subunit b